MKIAELNTVTLKEVAITENKPIFAPVSTVRVPAGFPSPAEGYLEKLDLNEILIKKASATYFYWVGGRSMEDVNIHDGDLLIVDASLRPENGDIVVAIINGEFTLKQIHRSENKLYLVPRNKEYKPIEITEEMNFQVRGVVSKVIHDFRKRRK